MADSPATRDIKTVTDWHASVAEAGQCFIMSEVPARITGRHFVFMGKAKFRR